MGWVHRHKHRGAVLALIALALQVALTFGHVHVRGPSGSSHAAIAEQIRLAHVAPQMPAQHHGDDDDYCAICASIFLASSAFAPAPPQLLVPLNFEPIEHSLDNVQALSESLRLAFRSRAPPVA